MQPLLFVLLSSTVLVHSLPSDVRVLDASVYKLPVGNGARVYFLTNGDEASLKQITVQAEKSNINSNVFSYAIPQADGSLNPLLITADDDTLVVTKPDGNTAQVSLYRNKNTQNLNVFPVFLTSSIKFKSGVNVFFNVDNPSNRILTLKNLNLAVNSGRVIASSGVPGDANPYTFFDSNVYPAEQFYSKLNIPLDRFQLARIDAGVTYEVAFDTASTSLDQSGMIMTKDFPLDIFPTDLVYPVNANGQHISMMMTPFFYSAVGYQMEITVNFRGGLTQGNNFPSVANGKLTASGVITSVEIDCQGPYSIQYFSNQTNNAGTTGTTSRPLITTTKSSSVFQIVSSIIIVLVSFLV